VEKLFEINPDGTVVALADMMKKKAGTLPFSWVYGREVQL